MSSTLDSIYFKDRESKFVMLNKACAAKHGWASPEEGIGKSDFDTFTSEHAEETYADEQRIMASGESMRGYEEREAWPDGRITWCSSTKMPLRDSNGAIIGIFGVTRDITARKEVKLRAQHYAKQIKIIKEELEEDALMAAQLQRSFSLSCYPVFPDRSDPSISCVEFLHRVRIYRKVSGDYCSIKRLSESKAVLFLCDVSGFGSRAALGAALIRGVMQEIEWMADDPAAYLARMNERLYPLLHPDRLLLDVTFCCMVLDVSTGMVRMASAGHPLPLHFPAGRPVKWLFENLVLRGPALAVSPDTRYRTIQCRLQPDDVVVLFTDGLFTVKNAQNEPFCENRLLGVAQDLAGKPIADIFKSLEAAATEFSKDGHFIDDVCLVGFHLRKLMSPP
jgi:sigma-B regulation protein RsbU (phosphoserine phosphatase)